MPSFLSEHFCENMTGKTVEFDCQPYMNGKGTITKIDIRMVENVKVRDPERGTMLVKYEVYDLEIACSEGTYVGARNAGVPSPSSIRDIAGTTERVTGVSYRQLYEACINGKTIVQAYCG